MDTCVVLLLLGSLPPPGADEPDARYLDPATCASRDRCVARSPCTLEANANLPRTRTCHGPRSGIRGLLVSCLACAGGMSVRQSRSVLSSWKEVIDHTVCPT
jgi:hypothetical protein